MHDFSFLDSGARDGSDELLSDGLDDGFFGVAPAGEFGGGGELPELVVDFNRDGGGNVA